MRHSQSLRPLAFTLSFSLAAWMAGITFSQDTPTSPWKANPDLVQKKSKQREFNYIESNVPKYELPDPLKTANGSVTADQWTSTRRDEILNLFRDHVYGRRPDTAYDIKFRLDKEVKGAFDGLATGRAMTASIHIEDRAYEFPFVVFVPNKRKAAVPAIVHINNRYFVPLEKAIKEADPFWPVKTMIERGFATASFHTSNVDPDKRDGYAKGVRSFFANGAPPEDKAWRSLSAWGWAASRVLDHLETLDAIDAKRVAVVGHSRGGKTSLWAACEDPRFFAAYSNNSGCGGAALSRRAYGETVARITTAFPHWFCKPFSGYAGREADLPVDQHEVIALIAPRKVYVTSADQDLWADPRGEYSALVAAAPVFRMLGEKAVSNQEMPALNQPRHVGATGYHIRTGGHGLGEQDWNWFMDFLSE